MQIQHLAAKHSKIRMDMKYLAIVLIHLLFLLGISTSSAQVISFPEGSIEVTFRANASGGSAGFVDFTSEKNANLDFVNADEPVISVIFQKLKWNKGFKEYQFVLKQAWVNEDEGFAALMPRLYKFKKGNRRIPLEIKKNGNHDLIIEFGILPPEGDINTIQPFIDKRVFKRVTVKGIKGAAPAASTKPEVKKPEPPKVDLEAEKEKKRLAEIERKRKEVEAANAAARAAESKANQEALRLQELERARKAEEAKVAAAMKSANVNAVIAAEALAAEAAEKAEIERLRLAEEEARRKAAAAKAYTPKEIEKKKEEFKAVKTENSFENYVNYIEQNPDDPFVKEAIDSIKKIPIHFEITEKVETSKDVYVFKIELADVKNPRVDQNKTDSLLQTEIKEDNTLTITTKESENKSVFVRDTFERKLSINIDPNYKTFTVDFEESNEKDSLGIVVNGGMSPFVIRFVQKGTKLKICPQKVGSKYMIAKSDLDCDLDGFYRVEVQDSRRLETKRSKTFYEFVDSSFGWLKFLWLPFIIILILVGYVIWKNM